jgi:hypothetical protein
MMEGTTATTVLSVTHLRHGECHSLLLPKLFGVSLNLVHALARTLAIVFLGHRVGTEFFPLLGQTMLVAPMDVGC